MRRWRKAGAVLAAWALLLQGCYESLPLQQAPPPAGVRVELVLNDQGRAALSDKLGTAVDKVEGLLVSQEGESYTMEVYQVLQMNGNSSTWNGERVTVAKAHAAGFQIRRLSRTRTTLLAGGITAAAMAVFFGHSLFGFGGSPTEPTPDTQHTR
jgi:hypothetical protein